MKDHGLAPAMEGGNDTGLGADMSRIEKELEEGISHTPEKKTGHLPDIEEPDLIELMGDSEDHVVMAAGQKPSLLSFTPLGDLGPLAQGTEAIAAGVVPVSAVVAFGTDFRMAAQFGGFAPHEGAGGLADVERERV